MSELLVPLPSRGQNHRLRTILATAAMMLLLSSSPAFSVDSNDAERGCYYDAHQGAPDELWDLPGPGRDAIAHRFSPTGRDSLMDVIFPLAVVGGFGNDTIIMQIYADSMGLPGGPSLAEVRLDPGTYWPDNIVDLSYLGLVFDSDFHISFTSSGTVGVDAE